MASLNQSGIDRQARLRRVKNLLVVLHDAFCSVFALSIAIALLERPANLLHYMTSLAPLAGVVALASALSLWSQGVFSSRWRLASLFDFLAIVRGGALVSLLLLIASAAAPLALGYNVGAAGIFVFFMFQCSFLVGGRVAYRTYRLLHQRKMKELENIEAIVFVGPLKEFDAALRAVEQGLLKNVVIAAGLLPRGASEAKSVRGVQVYGGVDQLEACCSSLRLRGFSVCAVLTATSLSERPDELRDLQLAARRLGLQILRLQPVDFAQSPGLVPLNFGDFFLRHEIRVDVDRIDEIVRGKSVLITGGGGSIGGEIARRVVAHGARELVIVDISEQAIQHILAELQADNNGCQVSGCLADVRDYARMKSVMSHAAPDIVVHSAALKHVDLAEQNWQEAIKTNVFGSLNVLQIASQIDLPMLVNISTDKAVDPVGMLGLTKRCAEILVARTKTIERRQVLSVRFGNVLGSSGSVVPIFLRQIASGGPVTVTDPAMKRYFMSIKEASELVLVSCSLAHVGTPDKAGMNTATFLLDMGEPVRIVDLAEQLIAWCGWTPHVDVKIAFTGLRPGERLEEALVAAGENASPSLVKGVFQLDAEGQGFDHIDAALTGLRHAIDLDDKNLARQALYALINAPVRLAVDAA